MTGCELADSVSGCLPSNNLRCHWSETWYQARVPVLATKCPKHHHPGDYMWRLKNVRRESKTWLLGADLDRLPAARRMKLAERKTTARVTGLMELED